MKRNRSKAAVNATIDATSNEIEVNNVSQIDPSIAVAAS